ncbi:MAG: UDP-N-acetylmuramoyl-L-alanine--D-glutamate ligase [Lentisphaeria bacterium]|nr:UDP-N-acetylmuramoyl-L-alanine--D-glutamate ligase [Lentisphaeria bacterium]
MPESVVIIGGGISGIAAGTLCRKHNIPCIVVNDGAGVSLPPGKTVVVSPGVHPAKSPLYQQAEAEKREIISEMEFGFRRWHRPVLAITGTNGKTTTTELTVHLLNCCGVKAAAAGNIGRPLSDLASDPQDTEVAVVEVSSFQLEKVEKFAPLAAAILNFASDHLDRYPDGFTGYCNVKKRIFEHVVPENRIWGLSFGDDCSRRVTVDAGILYVDGEKIFDLRESDLPGTHNEENCAAAVELILRILPLETVKSLQFKQALTSFRRGRHRIEKVGVFHGVTYIDDSKGTNPAAVLAAVDSCKDGKIVILLGGLGKGMDFSVLASRADRFRAAVVYGADRERIARVLDGVCPVYIFTDDFAAVVKCAGELALPGDTVLLSPACASMDMFKNYAERGECFRELAIQISGGQK